MSAPSCGEVVDGYDLTDLLRDRGMAGVQHAIESAVPVTAELVATFAKRWPPKGKNTRRTRKEWPKRRMASDSGESVIEIGPDLSRMADEAIAALGKRPNLFFRSLMLCRVLRDPTIDERSPVILSLTVANVQDELSAAAQFVAVDPRSEVEVPKKPSKDVATIVKERGQYPGIPRLAGIVESPCLRSDGSVLLNSGYDIASGLYCAHDGEMPVVPDTPTDEDVRAAVSMLLAVVVDFPFKSPAHRSAWIAGLLTMLARNAINGSVPFIYVDGNVRGVGKGKLAHAASCIATGHEMSIQAFTPKDDEMRKNLTSRFVLGLSVWMLDNIKDRVDLPSLEAAITAPIWEDRPMKESSIVRVPVRAVIWGSGNNAELSPDMVRRTLQIRLNSPVENPENRTFVHADLLGWIKKERRFLLAAALTILRAHAAKGFPQPPGIMPWGSFEDWCRVVRNAIIGAGLPDPCETREDLAAACDSERDSLLNLINALEETDAGRRGLKTGEIIEKASGSPALREALLEFGRDGALPNSRSLGKTLHRLRERVVDNRAIIGWKAGGGYSRWRVGRPSEIGSEPDLLGGDKRPELAQVQQEEEGAWLTKE